MSMKTSYRQVILLFIENIDYSQVLWALCRLCDKWSQRVTKLYFGEWTVDDWRWAASLFWVAMVSCQRWDCADARQPWVCVDNLNQSIGCLLIHRAWTYCLKLLHSCIVRPYGRRKTTLRRPYMASEKTQSCVTMPKSVLHFILLAHYSTIRPINMSSFSEIQAQFTRLFGTLPNLTTYFHLGYLMTNMRSGLAEDCGRCKYLLSRQLTS